MKYGIVKLSDDFEKKEDKCPFATYIEDYVALPYYFCNYSKTGICIEDKCPIQIVDMPEDHGDLIDRTTLVDSLEDLKNDWDYYGSDYENGIYKGYVWSIDTVMNAPAIIGADKEE